MAEQVGQSYSISGYCLAALASGPKTGREVLDSIGVACGRPADEVFDDYRVVHMALLRLKERGLVEREQGGPGNAYLYWLTQHGADAVEVIRRLLHEAA